MGKIFHYFELLIGFNKSDSTYKFIQNCDVVNQGPAVQSIVSLTSSLRVISLTVLVDSIYNILICFGEKM